MAPAVHHSYACTTRSSQVVIVNRAILVLERIAAPSARLIALFGVTVHLTIVTIVQPAIAPELAIVSFGGPRQAAVILVARCQFSGEAARPVQGNRAVGVWVGRIRARAAHAQGNDEGTVGERRRSRCKPGVTESLRKKGQWREAGSHGEVSARACVQRLTGNTKRNCPEDGG